MKKYIFCLISIFIQAHENQYRAYQTDSAIIALGFQIRDYEFPEIKNHYDQHSIEIIMDTADKSRTRLDREMLLRFAPYVAQITTGENICNKRWFSEVLRKRFNGLYNKIEAQKRPFLNYDDDTAPIKTQCGHYFHKSHLTEYQKFSTKCPVCTADIDLAKIVAITKAIDPSTVCTICQEEVQKKNDPRLSPPPKKRRR